MEIEPLNTLLPYSRRCGKDNPNAYGRIPSAIFGARLKARPLRHNATMNAPQTPTIQTEVQVMFFDTDCAAVVHNLAYLRFIEVGRTLLAEQLGMGLSEMASTGVFPVVVRIEIDY